MPGDDIQRKIEISLVDKMSNALERMAGRTGSATQLIRTHLSNMSSGAVALHNLAEEWVNVSESAAASGRISQDAFIDIKSNAEAMMEQANAAQTLAAGIGEGQVANEHFKDTLSDVELEVAKLTGGLNAADVPAQQLLRTMSRMGDGFGYLTDATTDFTDRFNMTATALDETSTKYSIAANTIAKLMDKVRENSQLTSEYSGHLVALEERLLKIAEVYSGWAVAAEKVAEDQQELYDIAPNFCH